MIKVCTCFIVLLFSLECPSAELYRYQDSEGRWVFGDKKSLSRKSQKPIDVEKITITDHRKLHPKPSMQAIKKRESLKVQVWLLKNPLPVTVQHWLAIKGKAGFVKSILAEPYEDIELSPADFESNNLGDMPAGRTSSKLEHYYLLGKPIEKPAQEFISPPFGKNKRFRISQGFKGKYSHSGRGNRFAVDIAMPIGEQIRVIKPGIVADGRDDFSVGGAANYFLDKANHVTVMHDDGTYGIYAHILYGSMAVAIGDRVTTGQVLARIGNTGYSTGPHLHFVLRYNSGRGAYSIPFKFQTKEGYRVPKQGDYYSGTF